MELKNEIIQTNEFYNIENENIMAMMIEALEQLKIISQTKQIQDLELEKLKEQSLQEIDKKLELLKSKHLQKERELMNYIDNL